LKLKEIEKKFLMLMVDLEKTADTDDSMRILNRMKKMIGRAKHTSIVDTTIFDHWLYGVVFEIFKLGAVKNMVDLTSIRTRISVSSEQLKEACQFLSRKGYLLEKDNEFVPSAVEFQPQNDVRRINSQQNHLKFFQLAQHRVNDELADREFQGL